MYVCARQIPSLNVHLHGSEVEGCEAAVVTIMPGKYQHTYNNVEQKDQIAKKVFIIWLIRSRCSRMKEIKYNL